MWISITGVVFMFLKGKSKILLIDIGMHDEVY